MARIKFLLAFLALLICAGGIGGAYFYFKKYYQPDLEVTKHIEGKAEVPKVKPDLGKRHFDAAMGLIKDGELLSARDRLLYLMEYFPESKTHGEAKRIVGELNMDLLLSNIPLEGKATHTVKRGEALVTIARQNKTTIDYIMRTNAKTTALIYPDEELIVFPLNFRAEINLDKKTVTIFDDGRFFKEYAIVDSNLPQGVSAPVSTSVSEKVAWHIDRPVNFTDENYMNCSKWLRTGKIGLFLRQYDNNPDGDRESRPYGVMLEKTDMEEIYTIMRYGSNVNLVS